jgi:hypothetical protein
VPTVSVTQARGYSFKTTRPRAVADNLTSAWCGEDGWAYFTAVIDDFDRVHLRVELHAALPGQVGHFGHGHSVGYRLSAWGDSDAR